MCVCYHCIWLLSLSLFTCEFMRLLFNSHYSEVRTGPSSSEEAPIADARLTYCYKCQNLWRTSGICLFKSQLANKL